MSDFLSFAQSHGLVIRDLVRGKIARCHTESKPTHKNGAYLFDGEWGWVQDHAQHTEIILWKTDKPLTLLERSAMQKRMLASREQHQRERDRDAQFAAKKAVAILRAAKTEQHAYLDAKGFPSLSGLVYYPMDGINLLVIPMRIGAVTVGCQMIDRDGGKKFLKGQRTNDAEYIIGSDGADWLVEGYATGLSLQACLAALKIPCRVHVCFSAGNLVRIAARLKKAYVVADNDVSGVGEKAAIATGHPYYLPEAGDLNDQHKIDGTFKASMKLKNWITGQKFHVTYGQM